MGLNDDPLLAGLMGEETPPALEGAEEIEEGKTGEGEPAPKADAPPAETSENEEPPALYAALFDNYVAKGSDEAQAAQFAAAEYARIEGIKTEEPASAEPAEAEDEEWELSNLALDAEDQVAQADVEARQVASQINTLNDEYVKLTGEIERAQGQIASLKGERAKVYEAMESAEDQESLRRARVRLEEITDQLSEANALVKDKARRHDAILSEYNSVLKPKESAALEKRQQAEVKQKRLKEAETLASRNPWLKADKARFVKMYVEGAIQRGTPPSQVRAALAEARVKAGKKPVASTAAATPSKAAKSWKEVKKALGSPSLKGAGGGSAVATRKTQSALEQFGLGDVEREANEYVEKVKGGKK